MWLINPQVDDLRDKQYQERDGGAGLAEKRKESPSPWISLSAEVHENTIRVAM
jgi:hypothetical protein